MTVIYVVLGAGWVVPIVLVVRDRIAQRTPGPKAPIHSTSTNEGVL